MCKKTKPLLCILVAGMLFAEGVGLATAADLSIPPPGWNHTMPQAGKDVTNDDIQALWNVKMARIYKCWINVRKYQYPSFILNTGLSNVPLDVPTHNLIFSSGMVVVTCASTNGKLFQEPMIVDRSASDYQIQTNGLAQDVV